MNCQCANTESVIVETLTTESHLIHDALMLGPPGCDLSAMSSTFAPQSIFELKRETMQLLRNNAFLFLQMKT